MDREQRRFVTGGTATSGMSSGLIETRGNAWATFNFNRGQGAVGSAALHISAQKCGCITIGVHPRTPEMILAEREALQRRASAEDRVVARRRGTDGETRHYRRSAGATSS